MDDGLHGAGHGLPAVEPSSLPQAGAVHAVDVPITAGSQVSTASTTSEQTVRGLREPGDAAQLSSPSSLTSISTATGLEDSTPAATPGAHEPFTALSPTVTPNPAKAAKHQVSQDFRNAGLIPAHTAPTVHAGNVSLAANSSRLSKPNLVDFAVQLQSEPGLAHWWQQVTQTLHDHFGAERATLAVATDSTDVENVPWAQVATYWAQDDDEASRRANETESSQGSLRDSISPASFGTDGSKSKTTASQRLRPVAENNVLLAARPKPETRHSYAGYPPRSRMTQNDPSPPVPMAASQKSLSPLLASSQRAFPSIDTGLSLNEELLRFHDAQIPKHGDSNEDWVGGGPSRSHILQPQQPLESEADPLITSTGVLRVFGREYATLLTREYFASAQSGSYYDDKRLRTPPATAGRTESKKSPGVGARPKHPRAQRRRTESSKKSPSASKAGAPPAAAAGPLAYEDYEQFPGTPWSQSPAPSPAARADPNDNPFFSRAPDQDAFAEDPPHHRYGGDAPIPAIGVDRCRSIIQLPLIHPSARLSHTLNSRAVREDAKTKPSTTARNQSEKPIMARHGSTPSTDNIGIQRIPIAILSIMAPNVPYPVELVESLNEMAPMLATSFYTARSHSNIIIELAALSGRRHPAGLKLNVQGERILGEIAAARGFNLSGTDIRVLSPVSPVSSTSTSTHSTATFPSARDSASLHSANATPGWESQDLSARGPPPRSSASPGDSLRESHEDYFSKGSARRRNSRSEQPLSPVASLRSAATSRPTSSRSKRTIHSQGATFASTQPSLPGAAAVVPDDVADPTGLNVDEFNIFREPSSSVLRTMIDNGATQQFIAEPDHGQLIWANAKFMAYRNASKDNIPEQLWGNIHHRDLARFQNEWQKSLESGEQLSHQVRLKRFDGQYRYFHVRFLPIKDKYGITKYWHGQAMDIHDLHEAEVKAAKSKEKLASEARYRALANSLPVIVFAASVPSGVTFANTQWMSYSGQTLEDAIGFGFLDHIHPDDLIKCRFPGVPTEGVTPPSSREKFTSRPGANPIVRSGSSVSSAPESEDTVATIRALGSTGFANDLDIPNELLRELATDGIIMCARDQQGNLSITTEMRLKNNNGQYRWHLVQGSYIESVDFGKGEAQWVIACTDISNQKQTEAKIQQANSALEDVNTALEKEMRQKMSYLSSMSHEIRTPLNGVIGNLQFLINSGLEETAAEWAHGAQEAAKNMHDLINDILDLSKAEANMLQLASHWFNPRALMEQTLDVLNSKAAEKEIELCFDCAEDVPKSIRGDTGRIRQVLLNLVANAIKFTQVGEVIIKCDLLDKLPHGLQLPELEAGEVFVRWTVTDTGTGFTAEDRKLLFKPYSQIKNRSTRDMGGTGLGLILCKTMVTLHGGAIDATSKPGLGSTFTFFARFKMRQESSVSHNPELRAGSFRPLSTTTPGSRSPQVPNSPASRASTAAEMVRDSPAILSDSSSAQSIASEHRTSMRSSASTLESSAPMKLTLPPHPTAPRSPDVSLSVTTKPAELIPVGSRPDASSAMSRSSESRSQSLTPLSPKSGPHRKSPPDLERTSFRPPMVSTLVVCQADAARRITCEQIEAVVPRSVPCNVTSVTTIQAALSLLHGEEPITFTHIVLRLSSDHAIHQAIESILAEPKHNRACVVVLADQIQIKLLKRNAPNLDLDGLSKQDRVKLVMKPAHSFKLAKIFDPFNENALTIKDPKEAKRQEEKRLQKESYALFKKVLGNKGIRVLAVEDDKLQMNILNNFLAKICCLDVAKAWNGQECLDMYKSHDIGYYSVIITDIEMPIMDGLTMCRRIRDWEHQVGRNPVPVVSLSANSFAEGWNQSSAAGFSHFCPKPVQFRELGNIILELTDPTIPHKFLSKRQMPKPMLKKLGLLHQDEEDTDEEIDF